MRLRNGPFAGLMLPLSVFVAVLPTHAGDCVRPSDDVVNGTALHAMPSTASPRVGTLEPGQGQNGRGGLFFVVQNADLASSISALIGEDSGPTE